MICKKAIRAAEAARIERKTRMYLMIVQIVTCSLDGDAVELDVRTLGDVLVERRLVDRCICAGMNVCAVAVASASILNSPPSILASMLKSCARIMPQSAAAARVVAGKRVVGVVIDQVVDLIDIELVAIVHRLVHHVGHHDGALRVEVVESDDRAAQAVGAKVEIDLHIHIDIHVVLDGIFDLVVDIVVDFVVDIVIDVVVELVIDLVLVLVRIEVEVAVAVQVTVASVGVPVVVVTARNTATVPRYWYCPCP